MRTLKIVALSLLMAATGAFALQAQEKKGGDAKTEKVVFDASIECNGCKVKIEKNLPFEKGVKNLVVDIEKKTVEVTFDPRKNDAESLRKALEKLGYKATVRTDKKA